MFQVTSVLSDCVALCVVLCLVSGHMIQNVQRGRERERCSPADLWRDTQSLICSESCAPLKKRKRKWWNFFLFLVQTPVLLCVFSHLKKKRKRKSTKPISWCFFFVVKQQFRMNTTVSCLALQSALSTAGQKVFKTEQWWSSELLLREKLSTKDVDWSVSSVFGGLF